MTSAIIPTYPHPAVYCAPPVNGVHPVFCLPSVDDVPFYEARGGVPELPLILWAESIAKRDAVLVDVGANIGTWSVLWGLLGHKIIAYEANPAMAALCSESLRRSRVWNADVRSRGLKDHPGPAILRYPDARNDILDGGASFASNFDGGTYREYRVEATTLDAENLPDLDFLKIDVEGATLDVLRGGVASILRHRPTILFEDWAPLPDRGHRHEELHRFLRDALRYTVRPVAWESTSIADPLP